MALRMSLCSAPVATTAVAARHASIKGQWNSRLVMCANNNQTSVNLQIKSSYPHLRNKVYEDREAGVVCYKDDETGEIICEGFDEGPRFHHQPSTSVSEWSSRDGEIKELLQRCWAQMMDENENKVDRSDKEMAVKKDF